MSLPAEPGKEWFVGLVKQNFERRCAEELRARKVSYYLPMQPCKVSSGRQMHDGMKIILPGFIFFHADTTGFYEAQETHRLWHVIHVKDQVLISRNLRDLLRTTRSLPFHRLSKLVIGKYVRVREGHSLAGLVGVISEKRADLIGVRVQCIGLATFHIKPEFLEVVERPDLVAA